MIMAIYYGPAEKSNILSRLNGIYMGSPTKEVNWNDFGMAADVYVGGFTNPKTAVLQDEPKFPEGDWRYECTFRTGADVTTKQGIFGQYPRPIDFLLPILGIRNGKFELFLSSTGKSWDIASNLQPDFALQANTIYGVILQCSYKSGQYTYSLYANKTWTSGLNDQRIWTLTTDKQVYNNAYYDHRAYISFGNHTWGVNAQAPFLGTINITKCRVYGYGSNLLWSGTGKIPKVSKIVDEGKNIKSVVAAGYNSRFSSYFGSRGYINNLNRIGFSTSTENAHTVLLPFDLTNPKVVKVSDYPVSLPTSDNFELGFEVGQTVNGKPVGLRQRGSGKLFELNDAATNLANEKCFGIIDGVNTTGIYLGFVEQGATTPLWGIACRNKLKTGQRVSVFSLYTGNDKVSRVQLKADGCLYYSTSVYNQSLITDVTSYVQDKVTWSDELTRQYLGYNG